MPEMYPTAVRTAFEPRWADLQDAADENPFIHAGVELLKSTVALVVELIGVPRPQPLPLDAAIRCALLVRASKLCMDLIADVCVGKGRLQVGLTRQITESLATLAYLCGDDEHGTRHRAFLYDSLISEREFLKVIEDRQAANGGTALPIEGRLRRSIEETARAAGIDLATIPGRRHINWPSAQERIEQVFGPTAYPAYRVGSDALHGGWFDLIRNHVTAVNGGFEPQLEPVRQRPQALLSAAIQTATIALTYLHQQPPQLQRLFGDHLSAALGHAHRADEMHEQWLSR